MPRKKVPETFRLVTMTEIVGPRNEVERADATISAILNQYQGCKIRTVVLSDPVKVPHAS